MKADELKMTFLEGSKRGLELLKVDLKNALNCNGNKVNVALIEKYLAKIDQKEKMFLTQTESSININEIDISELETDITLLLGDVVLNNKDEDNLYSNLKEIFYDCGYYLVFYQANILETPEYTIFPEVIFVGLPTRILHDRKYFPLVLHEAGHKILKDASFADFRAAIKSKVESLEEKAFHSSNLDKVNQRLLNSARYYERVSEPWLSELTSDIFGAYMTGLNYVEAFVLYQLNKRYFESIDDHPTNKVRYMYLISYLSKTEPFLNSSADFSSLLNSDYKADKKSKLFTEQQYQELILGGFEQEIHNRICLQEIKSKIRDLVKSKLN